MKEVINKKTGDTYAYLGFKMIPVRRGSDTEIELKEVYAYCPLQDHAFTIKAKNLKDWKIIKTA
jgi:hypothetical protein